MKKSCILLCSLVFLFFSPEVEAQNHDFHPCGTVDGKVEWLRKYQAEGLHFRTGNDTLFVPLTIHIVGNDNGSGYFSRRSLMNALCTLNEDFADSKIRFFIQGEVNYINNSTYNNHEFPEGQEMMETYRVPATINTYFVQSPAGNCGYSSYNLGVAMNKSCSGASDHTWAHEIGHFLSLPHPFWGWEGQTHDYNTPAPVQFGDILVERVDGVDCHLAADGFCDTAPDYLNYRWACNGDLESTVKQTDPNGEEFRSDATLFMSYAFDNCSGRFSEEQIDAMRANLFQEKADHLKTGLPNEPFDASVLTVVSPLEGEVLSVYENILFEWEAVPNAEGYVLEITIFEAFNSSLFSYTVEEGTSIVVPDLPKNRTIYWRLRPYNSSYGCEVFTPVATFETGEAPLAVSSIGSIGGMTLLPNPVPSATGLTVALESSDFFSAQVFVVNVAGQSQLVGNQYFTAGENQFKVETGNLRPGMYFLQLRSEAGVFSQRFVVW